MASLMRRMGFAEGMGSGWDRIVDTSEGCGLTVPSVSVDDNGTGGCDQGSDECGGHAVQRSDMELLHAHMLPSHEGGGHDHAVPFEAFRYGRHRQDVRVDRTQREDRTDQRGLRVSERIRAILGMTGTGMRRQVTVLQSVFHTGKSDRCFDIAEVV